MHPFARHLSRLSTALLLTILTGCGALPGETGLLGPKDVGADGGTVYSLDGNAYVVVPPGAIGLGQTVRISVEKTDATPPTSFGTPTGVAYRFEPSGTRFNSMVTLHTKYDEDELPPDVAADDLDLVLQSGATGQWAAMTEVVTNPDQGTISGKTSHFSVAAQVFEDSGRARLLGFQWPFAGTSSSWKITQVFGQYEEVFAQTDDDRFENRHHAGIDIRANAAGTDVRPIGPGTVWKIGRVTGDCERTDDATDDDARCRVFGNAVMIKHAPNLFSIYGHLRSVDARLVLGEWVGLDRVLGIEGATGMPGPEEKHRHLHLELRTFDQWSYPDRDASVGEEGNGYTIRHPANGGRGAHYIDPLRYMPELAAGYRRKPSPFVVRTNQHGVDAGLRPAPGYAYNGAASYRRADGQGSGLKLDEELEVVATAPNTTSLDCVTWYEVRPVVDQPALTRWVPDEGAPDRALYFLVTQQWDGSLSSVRTAWVCRGDRDGAFFDNAGDDDPGGAPAWSVSPSALVFDTPVGDGPIAPRALVVENVGDAAGTGHVTVAYVVQGHAWLSVSPSALSLDPGDDVSITVSASGCTGSSIRSATIALVGGGDSVQVPVTLNCREPAGPGVLSVSPTGTWSISGPEGGPFSSTSRAYTLSNSGGSPLSWGAIESVGWLGTSGTTSGTLQAGATATVTFVLDVVGSDSASQLSLGTHTTALKFSDHTAGLEISRTARIVVEANEAPLPVTELVTNGTFTYRTGWSTAGHAWIWNGSSESAYRSGPGYAALGVDTNGNHVNGAVGLITQEVHVPAGATHGEFSLYYNMTSSEPIATADSFPLAITTRPCLGPNQVVGGFTLNASHKHAAVGSYVRRAVEFDVQQHAGTTLCVVLAGSTNESYPTVLRLDDVSLRVWGE